MEKSYSRRKKFYGEGHYNHVMIHGILEKEFSHGYNSTNMTFYESRVTVERVSETEDHILIVVEEPMLSEEFVQGAHILVKGRLYSYSTGRLQVALLAESIELYDEDTSEDTYNNLVHLEGKLHTNAYYKESTLTNRKITEFLLCSTRANGKKDYIPCISWGKTALQLKGCKIGEKINLTGRIQSRVYFKPNSETDRENGEYVELREVSIIQVAIG